MNSRAFVPACLWLLAVSGAALAEPRKQKLPPWEKFDEEEGIWLFRREFPGSDVVALTPDRRRDGTNVMSVPARSGFRFAYGAGSFDAHRAEAERCGLVVVTVEAEHLAWDVDRPDDLDPPDHLGQLPLPGVLG